MLDQPEQVFSGRLSQDDLDVMIKKHEAFVTGIKGGQRLILQFMNLSGLDFSGHNLSEAIFTGSALIQANMSLANLERANFFGCDMRYANLEGASLVKCDLRGVCARGARLDNADMSGADLREGQVLAHERSGELQALYIDMPAPASTGQTDFSKAKMVRVQLNEAQAGHADFSEAEMRSVRMRNANMRGANFEGANLEYGDLTGADMTQSNMRECVMLGLVLHNTKMEDVDTEGALTADNIKQVQDLEMPLEELIKAHQLWVETAGKEGRYLDLSGFDLRQVRLQGKKMTAARAHGAVFLGMNLTSIELQHTYLDKSNFRNAILVLADLRGSSLREVNFTRADLRRANLQPLVMANNKNKIVDLTNANFRHADLRGADFKYAVLDGADFAYAQLEGADFSHARTDKANWKYAEMVGAKGLNVLNLEDSS